VKDTGAVAAVDCGTNSTRLLVVGAAGDVKAREMRITRLGEGVDATRRLRPEAMERTCAALKEFRSIMDAHDVMRARLVATSAVRDAENGDAFLRAASEIIGVPAELLSGQEEGRLSYAGATAGLPEGEGGVVVVDIGGGSTEIVAKPHGEVQSVSLDIGCVRLTERFLRSDPPTADEVADAVGSIDRELDRAVQVIPELAKNDPTTRLVGLAGTVSTLASVELGLEDYDRDRIHGAVLTREAVAHWCEVLGREAVAERARRPAIPEGRQDVIFGGALVLNEVMRRFGLPECIVSESDILDGLVMSMQPSHPSSRPGQAIE
jgi:exopolyphosphatase / guanosine-5'-triphosphate,3'-diphosphate pyrophosphatase